jgi:hypothetical protein
MKSFGKLHDLAWLLDAITRSRQIDEGKLIEIIDVLRTLILSQTSILEKEYQLYQQQNPQSRIDTMKSKPEETDIKLSQFTRRKSTQSKTTTTTTTTKTITTDESKQKSLKISLRCDDDTQNMMKSSISSKKKSKTSDFVTDKNETVESKPQQPLEMLKDYHLLHSVREGWKKISQMDSRQLFAFEV